MNAKLEHHDGQIFLILYEDEARQWIGADPDDRDWPMSLYIYADHEKYDRGEYEIVGFEALDVSLITDEWLAALDTLDLPRIDVPEAGLRDVTVSDALRWARQTFPSRYTGVTA